MADVIARFDESSIKLGRASNDREIEKMIEKFISRYGADYLGELGIQFDVVPVVA